MTDFLISKFITDYQNIKEVKVREKYGILSGVVGIVCNVLLFVLKLVIGVITNSVSITADAINNLSDCLSSVISVVSFKVSGRKPDARHPFGYGRVEYVAGLLVSFLIVYVGIEFIKTSVDRILHPQQTECSIVLLLILGISVFLKLWMGMFHKKIGKRISSTVLLAAMQDSINDVITTLVVICGMVLSRFTALPVDGFVGIAVAVFIILAGVNIAKDTMTPLLGTSADPEMVQEIIRIVMEYDDIVGVHDVIMHSYGAGKYLASIHAEVPDNANFTAVHETIDEAEKRVQEETGITLVIHMDPIAMNDDRVNHMRTVAMQEIRDLDQRLTMHDFRIVDGTRHINLIFDVVVPFEYDDRKKAALQAEIDRRLREKDKRYRAVITFDYKM